MNSYQFFLKHAGYSDDPQTETRMQGRVRGARALARAEREARDAGLSFQWGVDDTASSDWLDDNQDGGKNCNPWRTWYCCAYAEVPVINTGYYGLKRPAPLASLSGIDFGRDGEPWGSPYKRVVEAELALEALDK